MAHLWTAIVRAHLIGDFTYTTVVRCVGPSEGIFSKDDDGRSRAVYVATVRIFPDGYKVATMYRSPISRVLVRPTYATAVQAVQAIESRLHSERDRRDRRKVIDATFEESP